MLMGGEILIQLNILDNNQLSIRFIDQGVGFQKNVYHTLENLL